MVTRYFTAINLLLITVGVYFAVTIFYAVVTPRFNDGPSPMPARHAEVAKGTAPASRLADYRVIVERNLFNSGKQALAGAEKTADAALDVDKLKQTDLKVKLVGTTRGSVDQAWAAAIEDPKTREHKLYRTGDTLQNATIKMILREKVVLTVNGKDEVLNQEEPGVVKTGAPGAAARADAGPAARPPAEPVQQVVVQEEQIEKAMESLSELMTQATFRPHLEDGQPAGISITGIKPNAVFRKLRLRNGDVITGVNDQSIASVEDAMKVFGTLSTETPIQVKIKRRGREETLEYKIE
jgi:general secretion pathway protein C